jgi:hypothetical protein
MSIANLTKNNLYKQKIYISSCECDEGMIVKEKLEVKDFIFDAQNGDKVELSKVADKGVFGAVLKSDGSNGVFWGSDLTGGISYNGTLPTIDGGLSLYSGIDGTTIKNSSLTETDLINTQNKANNNESNITNLQNDKVNKAGDTMTGILNMNNNDIDAVGNIEAVSLDGVEIVSGTTLQDLALNNGGGNNIKITNCNLDLDNNDIINATDVYVNELLATAPAVEIQVRNNLRMRNNNIVDATNIQTDTLNNTFSITTQDIKTDTISTNTTGKVLFNDDLDLFSNNILSSGNIKTTSFSSTDFKTNDIDVNANFDMNNNNIENVNNIQNVSNVYVENIYGALGTINMNNEVDLGTELIKGNIAQFNNLSSYNTLDDILINNNLNLNQVELKDAKNLEIKNPPTSQGNTKFITDVSQLPTAIGGFHLLEDNTSYIICGQITLTNGIEYGNNCSMAGIDFSASITFDETLNDIVGFKSVDTNVYLSKLTIIGGGGRFSGVPSFTNGLFNCDDFDVAGGFPFYGRNRRFKVDGCNFITPYSMGRVRGYATLNFNNNLISGTGAFNTYEGLEVIDGLSLEFLGNKIVLHLLLKC